MRSICGYLNKHLVRGIFLGMFAILLFRAGGADAAALALNCGQWNVVPSPNGGPQSKLNGVTAISANNVWAVGTDRFHNQPLIEHWDGTQWSLVPSPGSGLLLNISGSSANDIWAVGTTSLFAPNHVLIEHWDGTQWSIVSGANLPHANTSALDGVTAISSDNVWATGSYAGPNAGLSLVEHWDGTQWSVVPSPNVGQSDGLSSVAAVSPNDIWAVGGFFVAQGQPPQPLIEHWDGTQWS